MATRPNKWDGPERREESEKRGVRFDATVNLGHLLTFAGFLIAGFGAWTTLDKRVVVLEENRKIQTQIDQSQDSRSTDISVQIKDAMQRLERQVERLNDKLDKTPGANK